MSVDGTRRGASGTALAGAYVGSVIGAGFASGQEHAAFFLRFGTDGLWGLCIAGAMFVVFGAGLLLLAHRHGTRSHVELLQAIAAPPVALLFDWLLTVSLFVSLSVMMAGGGALLCALAGVSESLGSLGMAVLTLAIALLGVDAMLRVNAALAAVLSALIACLGIASFPRAMAGGWPKLAAEPGWAPSSWFLSAVLYGSYNLALTLTVFGALGSEIRRARQALAGGVSGGALLFFLSLCVCAAVTGSLWERPGEEAFGESAQIPLLLAAARLGPVGQAAFSVAIGVAMLTTAVASTYALARRLAGTGSRGFRYAPAAVLAVGASLPLAGIGFSRLVGTLYPVIGYVGAGSLALTALLWMRTSRRPASR